MIGAVVWRRPGSSVSLLGRGRCARRPTTGPWKPVDDRSGPDRTVPVADWRAAAATGRPTVSVGLLQHHHPGAAARRSPGCGPCSQSLPGPGDGPAGHRYQVQLDRPDLARARQTASVSAGLGLTMRTRLDPATSMHGSAVCSDKPCATVKLRSTTTSPGTCRLAVVEQPVRGHRALEQSRCRNQGRGAVVSWCRGSREQRVLRSPGSR